MRAPSALADIGSIKNKNWLCYIFVLSVVIFFVVEFGRLKALNVNGRVRFNLLASQYPITPRVNQALYLVAAEVFELRVKFRYGLNGLHPLPLVKVRLAVRIEQKSANQITRCLIAGTTHLNEIKAVISCLYI